MTGSAIGTTEPTGGWLVRFYQSTIGRKIVMAVTGVTLIGFITVHMAGNLLVHRGPAAINGYAALLASNVLLLWGTRIVVLVSLVFHVHSAVTLSRRAAAARPDRYAKLTPQASSWSARTMRIGGVLLAVFIGFHILHFTTGTVLPSHYVYGEVYQNVVRSFSIRWVAIFYLVAMLALALHLHHGVSSLFQTLGVRHPNVSGLRGRLAWVLAIAIPIGFASVPLAVLLGMIH